MRRLVLVLLCAALGGGAAMTVGVLMDDAAELGSREAHARALDEGARLGREALDAALEREERRATLACSTLPVVLAVVAPERVLDQTLVDAPYERIAVFGRADTGAPWTRLAARTPHGLVDGEPLAPSTRLRLDDGPPRAEGAPLVSVVRATGRVECWDAADTHALVATLALERLVSAWPEGGPTIELVDPDAERAERVAELRWIETPTPGARRFAVVLPRVEPAPSRARAVYAALFAMLGAMLGVLFGGGSRGSAALTAAAERVGKGDLDVTLSGRDATSSAFNRMTRELRDARRRSTRVERVAAWRETAQRVAHEIKNPLTPIRMAVETLRKARARNHPDEPEIFEESTRAVLEEVNRLDKIATDFGRFARLPRPTPEDVNVREAAQHVVSLAGLPGDVTATDGALSTSVELSVTGTLPTIRADREQLSQVLTNLVHNALDAARAAHAGGGRVRVALAAMDDGVRITVEDDGPGIALDDREKVLEPYFTTKPTGTGLGLAIVDRIVSEHEGTLEFARSETLGGAAVIVTLRTAGPSPSAEASRTSAP